MATSFLGYSWCVERDRQKYDPGNSRDVGGEGRAKIHGSKIQQKKIPETRAIGRKAMVSSKKLSQNTLRKE